MSWYSWRRAGSLLVWHVFGISEVNWNESFLMTGRHFGLGFLTNRLIIKVLTRFCKSSQVCTLVQGTRLGRGVSQWERNWIDL